MTIPSIASYPVPCGAELPVNKVAWRPEPARASLLIHDMQEYFLRFYERDTQPIATALANIARLASACRERGMPVFYTAQPPLQSPEQRGLLHDMWGPGITAEPEAHAIARELSPHDGDVLITKYRYSAFHHTPLLSMLRDQRRDQLIVCGVYAHIGCLLTACDAFMNDVQPFFVTDAVADFSSHYHKLAIGYAAERCAVTLDSDALLGALASSGRNTGLNDDELRAVVAGALDVAARELDEDADLFELGLDSIRLMSLVESLRARGAEVTFPELAECRTLREVQRLALQRRSREWEVAR